MGVYLTESEICDYIINNNGCKGIQCFGMYGINEWTPCPFYKDDHFDPAWTAKERAIRWKAEHEN